MNQLSDSKDCACYQPFFLTVYLFIYFWLLWAFVAVHWLSLVEESGGCSLTVVCGLLIVLASPVAG